MCPAGTANHTSRTECSPSFAILGCRTFHNMNPVWSMPLSWTRSSRVIIKMTMILHSNPVSLDFLQKLNVTFFLECPLYCFYVMECCSGKWKYSVEDNWIHWLQRILYTTLLAFNSRLLHLPSSSRASWFATQMMLNFLFWSRRRSLMRPCGCPRTMSGISWSHATHAMDKNSWQALVWISHSMYLSWISS